MDDPQIERAAHVQALRGLARVYAISRTGTAVWRWIRTEAASASRTLSVLDLATGGGDWPVDLACRARRAGFRVRIAACDVSHRALAFARLRAARKRVCVRLFPFDVCGASLPGGYDILTSGLFLHHLSRSQAVQLLREMARVARRAILVDDLRRTRRGLWLARVGTRLLSRSPVVHVDAVRSVRAAFTVDELAALAAEAGLAGAEICRHWPQRQLLVWRRNHTDNTELLGVAHAD
jgi:SAM-dependent methyltransferase